jgi:hypothetical protein
MSNFTDFVSDGTIKEGSVDSSAITNSTIDMNNGVITTHGTPINSLDVVNKNYIDTRIKTFTLTLAGTNYTSIVLPPSTQLLTGNFYISVNYISSANGPNATFFINKSDQTAVGTIFRVSSSAGKTTLERLMINWPSNSTPSIHKTGTQYNGTYQIVVLTNYIGII